MAQLPAGACFCHCTAGVVLPDTAIVNVAAWFALTLVEAGEVLFSVLPLALAICTAAPVVATAPRKLFVALFSVTFPAEPVPVDIKLAAPLMLKQPEPVCVILLPDTSDRFVPTVALDRLMAAVFTIGPVVLLPMVS